jgi:hypothetical protein
MIMKFKIFGLFSLVMFLLASCAKEDQTTLTDAEMIQAIQMSGSKQSVSPESLPEPIAQVLVEDFTESYVEEAYYDEKLGYEITLFRNTASSLGEITDIYFTKHGRELLRDGFIKDRGIGGRDREECFKLVYPVTYIMPDGTEITGNSERELKTLIKAWYKTHKNVRKSPVLKFPVQIEFADGRILTINSVEELRKAYEENCRKKKNDEFDCPKLRANIGDKCHLKGRIEGKVNANCECE